MDIKATNIMITAYKKLTPSGRASIIAILIIVIAGILAGRLSVYPYNSPSGTALQPPDARHWLGTDDLGIDLWAQICYGARLSIIVGMGTALLAGIGGCLIGTISGYFGGLTDKIVMRVTDVMIVLPDLPMMIVIGAFFGPSIGNIILVLALFSWTASARIIRSKIMSVKQENYITAAKSYGAGFWHFALKHFFPVVLPIVAVSIIRLAGRAIVAEASLSFLGLGDPTSKSWGLILNHAMNFEGIYFTEFWKWWITAPLLAITIMVSAIAIFARDLEKFVNTK